MVLHYVANISPPSGPEFLKTILLWYACPWTLSTAVVLGGALGMVAIGVAYAILGRMDPAVRVEGVEKSALFLCTFALIAIFLTGYVGYFAINRIWPNFDYSAIRDGKDVWLLMQLACMVAYAIGVFLALTVFGVPVTQWLEAGRLHASRLPFLRLHRYEPHAGPGDRLAQCLGVGRVVLAALHVGLHVLRRN